MLLGVHIYYVNSHFIYAFFQEIKFILYNTLTYTVPFKTDRKAMFFPGFIVLNFEITKITRQVLRQIENEILDRACMSHPNLESLACID